MSRGRGQSTQLGVVLLVAVFVAATATTSVFVLDSVTGETAPSLELDGRVTDNADALMMKNIGGESVSYADISVVVIANNETSRIRPESDAGNENFEPGMSFWQPLNVSVDRGDIVTVIVVHEPTDQQLFEGEKRVVLASGGESGDAAPSLSVSVPDSIKTPGSAVMTASSSDPEVEPVTFEWRVVNGSAYASVSPPTSNKVKLIADAVDTTRTVTIEVTASDGATTTTRRVDVTLVGSVDDTPPAIDLSATGTGTDDGPSVTVAVESSEQLAELTVHIIGDEIYTLKSWSESINDDVFVYEGSVTDVENRKYTVSVREAQDEKGIDGADSSNSVTICAGEDECNDEEEEDDEEDEED